MKRNILLDTAPFFLLRLPCCLRKDSGNVDGTIMAGDFIPQAKKE